LAAWALAVAAEAVDLATQQNAESHLHVAGRLHAAVIVKQAVSAALELEKAMELMAADERNGPAGIIADETAVRLVGALQELLFAVTDDYYR
jgi:hypothetical protein